MENDSLSLPIDIYAKHLHLIGDIEFTQREVDILACLVGGKPTKTIPSFLSIAGKTVVSHISRIKLKTGCVSQENIINFVENSGKASILKERYYFKLCNQVSFEKQLKRIPKIERALSSRCFIVYEKEQKDKFSFLHYLEDHLKLAGFRTEIKIKEGQKSAIDFINALEAQQNDHILYVLPQSSDDLNLNNEKCTFLLAADQLENRPYVNFSGTENYYFSVFQLLKTLRTDFYFDKIIEDFKKSCEEASVLPEKSEPRTYLQNKAKTNGGFLEVRLKQRSKILSFVFLLLSFVGVALFVAHWHVERNTVPLIQSNLPPPTESMFLNRPELITQLDDKFRETQGIQSIALVGIGGTGKTILAQQYARSQNIPFVCEINAETKESLASSFESLAKSLASTEDDKKLLRGMQDIKDPIERENSIIQFVKQRLNTLNGWFLIYDNVEKFTDIQKYFPQDSRTWGKGKIILTTRDENIQNNKCVNHVILIGELSANQKFSLFTQIMWKNSSLKEMQKKAVEEFLKKIPSFPLDVSIAAYYLKATSVSYKDYLSYLNRYNEAFEHVQKNLLKEAGDYVKTRYGIITVSLQHLLKVHQDFRDLLLFISLLDSQKIPRNLLNKYKNNIIVDDFVHNLKKYSLVTDEVESFSVNPSISMHRSTQEIILDYLVHLLDLKERNQILSASVRAIEGYMTEAEDNEDFLSMRSLVTHLEAFLNHNDLLNKELKGTIGGILGCIYNQLGDYEKSKMFLTQAFSNLNEVDSKNPRRMSKVLAFLGIVYSNLGDYEKASTSLEQSFVESRNTLVDNTTTITTALAHLGNLYISIGQYDKALHLLQKSLSICKEYFPETHVKRGSALVFLGHLYLVLGQVEEAMLLFEEALTLYQRNVPQDDIAIGWILRYLGSAHMEIGQYKKAKELLEHSLVICKKHFSEQHSWVLWVLADLGLVYSHLGDHEKALTTLKESLKGYESHYGQDHLETASILKNLGRTYFAQGNNDIAEKHFNRALTIFETHKHPERYICLEGLSNLYLKKANEMNKQEAQNLKREARVFLQQALSVVEAHFPKDSPHLKRIKEKIKFLDKS